MSVTDLETDNCTAWTRSWLDAVASGASTMSQRKRASIEAKGGGLESVKAAALKKNIHLLRLFDDQGNEIIAASLDPFEVVC